MAKAHPDRRARPERASLLALAVLGLSTLTAGAAGPKGVVYVESNDPAGNAILAYRRADDGSLAPLAGSPFRTGGRGVSFGTNLGPYDSDQVIIADPSGRYLFAVNGGSDSIAAMRIAGDGALKPVAGSPFASGGSQPSSLGLLGDVLAVVNKAEDPGRSGQGAPNYTTFRVGDGATLAPIRRSTFTLDNGADPSQALIGPAGRLMFGADFLGGVVRSFAIDPAGRLDARAAMAPPAFEFADTGAPALPLGLAAHPDRPLLYVGFVTINRVGIYRYDAAGRLRYLRSVPDSGKGVCWLLINRDATRMYASNTVDPSVSVYDLADPAEPVEIQKVNLAGAGGPSNPGGYQIALDPSNRFLHVVSQRFAATSTAAANALHTFAVGDDGKIEEVESSPLILPVPANSRPQGLLAF